MTAPRNAVPRAAVIGAGPVGCLAALSLANRGFQVDIYERRPDPRSHQIGSSSGSEAKAKPHVDRSINLAISARGLKALGKIQQEQGDNLADVVLNHAVPMYARMIHTRDEGKGVRLDSQPYSSEGKAINSVSRGLINTLLLDEASFHPRIEVHFSCKLRSIDFDARSKNPNADADCQLNFETFEDEAVAVTRFAAFAVGTDGIHSIVRNTIAQISSVTYRQDYIDSEYLELRIPPTSSGDYAIDANHLHIWPRVTFMLIALANLDHSFTSTLFAPQQILAKLSSPEAIIEFFKKEFPDALELMGADAVVESLLPRKGRGSKLCSVQCNRYHYKGQAIILGDAAHAMLPFYGQGLNCGFEDVSVMMEVLDKAHVSSYAQKTQAVDASKSAGDELGASLEKAFSSYSSTRHDDLIAINYLASQNYVEMSSSVIDPLFLLRKRIDALLMKTLPKGWWNSLYNMVTFSPNVGYAEAKKREDRQKVLLERIIVASAGVGAVGLASLGRLWWIRRW